MLGPAHWGPDLVEAYVRSGRTEDAMRAAERYEEEEREGNGWARAALARCRGLLAGNDAFTAEFTAALDGHDLAPALLSRGRTELCFGERLRRAGRRREATVHLGAALDIFDRLGARPWADRARVELGVGRRDHAAAEQLTPQELQVALRVAAGETNRQAAAELFLSPKTIEYHLANVYRKLDLHSRAQLARFVARHEHPVAGNGTQVFT